MALAVQLTLCSEASHVHFRSVRNFETFGGAMLALVLFGVIYEKFSMNGPTILFADKIMAVEQQRALAIFCCLHFYDHSVPWYKTCLDQ